MRSLQQRMDNRQYVSYTHYKNLWESVKPIRGRSVEVRPIGERRRDWEQIVRKPMVGGEYSYAARLYNTDVVEYLPNGNIILRTGGWETPSTAEFIWEHSPFTAWKKNGKVWISTDEVVYPVGAELELHYDHNKRRHVPVNSVLIQKKVVDRAKAKDARAPMKPFLDWAKVFLKMSDGWIMHSTRKEVLKYVAAMNPWGFDYAPMYDRHLMRFMQSKQLYEHISNAKPDDYPAIMCSLLRDPVFAKQFSNAETVHWEGVMMDKPHTFSATYHDLRFDFDVLKQMVYGIVSQAVDIMTIKEVQPTSRAMTNVL